MTLRFGRYEAIREIASGGMATVYLGRVTGEGGFQRLCAIKVMHPHLGKETEFVAMFLDEARLAARIRHPNVVATLDVQKLPEGLFLVMDYVEGASLFEVQRHLRKQDEKLPLGLALRVLLDTLTGLHVAHDLKDDNDVPLNVVHRDVSPHNVLIGKDGVARLTDFGVARAEARLSSTRGSQLKGKVPYMPPEQIVGGAIDRRSDVYAAGVVLWETLVGRRLFRAENDGALVHAIVQGASLTPAEANKRVPEPISDACMRALALSPSDRYPTAASFADELEDAARVAGVPIIGSRALSTFMEQLLPELTAARASASQSPPANLPGSGPSGSDGLLASAPVGSAGSAPERPGVEQGSSGSTVGGTEAEVAPPQPATSRRRTMLLVSGAAGGLLLGALVAVTQLGAGPGSAPGSGSPPTTAAPEAPSAAASSPAPSSAVTVTASDAMPLPPATVVAAPPSAEPGSPTSRPRGTGGRPGSTGAKPRPTSYDPDKL